MSSRLTRFPRLPSVSRVRDRTFGVEPLRLPNRVLARAGLKVVPARVGGDDWTRAFLYYSSLVDQLDEIPGAIVECGVSSGNSLAMLAALARTEGKGRRIIGFDWWKGLPEPTDLDRGKSQRGMFASSQKAVWTRLGMVNLAPDDVQLVQGRLEHTLRGFSAGPIALLHIDVDLYESYLVVLRNLWSQVAKGGIVAFDEYRDPPYPGATRAVDEFLAERPGQYDLRRSRFNGCWYSLKLV